MIYLTIYLSAGNRRNPARVFLVFDTAYVIRWVCFRKKHAGLVKIAEKCPAYSRTEFTCL